MGRPKLKHAKRDTTTGRSRGEPEEDIQAVAITNRVRMYGEDVATVTDLRTGKRRPNPMAGYTLGVLRLQDEISQGQYEAGEAYASLVYRYSAMRGLPLPFPKSPSLMLIAAGQGCGAEPSDDEVIRVRRKFSDARRLLLDAGMAIGVGSRVNAITYEVCIEDRAAKSLSEADIGNLRVGLNAVGRLNRGA